MKMKEPCLIHLWEHQNPMKTKEFWLTHLCEHQDLVRLVCKAMGKGNTTGKRIHFFLAKE